MKKIDCLKQFLIRCCYQYYVKSNPMIDDRLYDALFDDMKYRESMRLQKEGIEPDSDSPTQMIWGDSDSQYSDWAKERKKMEACTEN